MNAVDLLGSVRVEDGLPLAPRDRRVLAALAISAGLEVSAETLSDALWGEWTTYLGGQDYQQTCPQYPPAAA